MGPNIRWPLVLTQKEGGTKPSFPIFLLCQKKNCGQRGAMADLAKAAVDCMW